MRGISPTQALTTLSLPMYNIVGLYYRPTSVPYAGYLNHAPLSCRRSAGKCSQTDRKIKAKDISKKDNTSVTQTDLKKGSSLMMAVTGKDLPYRVCRYAISFCMDNVLSTSLVPRLSV